MGIQNLKNRSPKLVGLPIETREAPIVEVNEDDRTIEVVWTAGATVKRYDWISGETYMEELVVTDKAVRLDRLNSGGPVLDNHKAYGSVGDMLAVIDRAWIKNGEGRAIVRFPKAEDDEAADKIFRKIKDGIITRLSCGYRRLKIEVDKTKTPKVWRIIDWEPFEISFVTVPADVKAKVRSKDAETFGCEFVGGERSLARKSLARMKLASKRSGI